MASRAHAEHGTWGLTGSFPPPFRPAVRLPGRRDEPEKLVVRNAVLPRKIAGDVLETDLPRLGFINGFDLLMPLAEAEVRHLLPTVLVGQVAVIGTSRPACAVVGAVLPLLGLHLARALHLPGIFLFRFFAGFCLISNGVYIGLGSIQGLADAGDMLHHGSSRWQLILFGIVATPLGLYLWNGIGPKFGLGEARGTVSRAAAVISLALFAVLVGAEMMIGSR